MNRRLILGLPALLALGFPGLLALAGCGSPPPPPPVLTLTIKGGADQNPDTAGRASPVAVRVYQLSGTAKFEQTDVFALKDSEAKTLGSEAAAGSQEFLIAPGDTKKITIDLKPMVSAVGVAVMYRDIDNAKWRATAPAAAHGPTELSANVGKLALTLK
jgi:type VI secretion system protein VasD